ncbi:LOW QUALITY PROTEIN: immunoglobulin superfamily DCC subclass member 3 [Camelus ferus]|uniref:LOW QUALITY PROTEIN: immunoglobulin superfamily DCC subclass member 3 n=1 Tax=Camelus ferus TaxID=419612 RepID=UPI0013A6590E|nr:LOW QUALITY PROTEIN: immunoglobulin superfamily DCC subclass member 3 [Camelus ferus]
MPGFHDDQCFWPNAMLSGRQGSSSCCLQSQGSEWSESFSSASLNDLSRQNTASFAKARTFQDNPQPELELVGVGAPRLLQEPEILSGPQNLTLVSLCLPEPPVLCPFPALTPCLPADGRSIGVEGIQVLGTGNLMISDVLVQHSSIYVCAANRPGIRIRRTAQGVLLVQAPPEFVQWPQSLSKPPGSSAIFTCVAQGVPEPLLVWLKNGKGLSPGNNIRLTHNNSTLMLAELSAKGEAIYQCVAENSAGSNQASARLAVTGDPEPPPPQGLQAVTLSTSAIRVSWEPPTSNGDVIGYVLHLQPVGEPAGPELQEAVGKGTFEHVFSNLEPATAYSIHLWAYSAEGSSQDSVSIHASTMGSTPAALGFSTKVLNATSVQASWELPPQMGPIQGFKLTASCWLPTLRGPCSRLALSVPSSTQIWVRPPSVPLLSVVSPQALSFLAHTGLFASHYPAPPRASRPL